MNRIRKAFQTRLGWARLDPFRPRDPRADAMGALVSALVLSGLGLICVYSFGSGQIYRQVVWAVLSISACLIVSRLPLDALRRLANPLMIFSAGLLLLALLFAEPVSGTRRWLVIPHIGQFQPSELAKIAVVLYLSAVLARREALERGVWRVAWPVGGLALLVLLEPDLGTAVFLATIGLAILLIGGARLGRVLTGAALLLPVLLLVASQYPYMRRRLEFFEGHRNHQQIQALLAIGSGGFFGSGLGSGRQKMAYLPEGHTDFVFSNICEELGFIGVLSVGVLFALLLIYGLRVALSAERRNNRFGFFVACGATFFVVFQAVLNIAVATAAAPTKGISLPFLSHGGSNLLVSFVAIGLIVSVGRSMEAKS